MVPDRLDGDFVLSFRRGEGCWKFCAGRRVRQRPGAEKSISDGKWSRAQRHMFWAACLESALDGYHYVLVGTVPGMLMDHFFVAKTARAEPLSRAGFSYLPEHARLQKVEAGDERPPLQLESIFVYPHVLAGELPFVSLRNLQQQQQACEDNATAVKEEHGGNGANIEPQPLACVMLPEAVPVAPASEEVEQEPAARQPMLELVVTRAQRHLDEDTANGPETWCLAARRECGLPPRAGDGGPELEAAKQEALERRARQRVTAPVLATDFLEAPVSWEPAPEQPAGGFAGMDDTARHDPLNWPTEETFEAEEAAPKEAQKKEEPGSDDESAARATSKSAEMELLQRVRLEVKHENFDDLGESRMACDGA